MNLLKFMFIVMMALSAAAFFPVAAQSNTETLSGKWTVTLRHKSYGEMRLSLDFEETGAGSFSAYSHRNAVKNILGSTKAALAKTAGPSKMTMLRTGALCGIEKGVFSSDSEGIHFQGAMYIPMGVMDVKGTIQHGKLEAVLTQAGKNTPLGRLDGVPATHSGALDNYKLIVDDLMSLYQQKIYNREVLKTRVWKKFESKMRSLSTKAMDDLELVSAFFMYSEKLPFTHRGLYRVENPGTQQRRPFVNRPGQIILEEKTPETVVLRVLSFHCTAHEMDSVMQIVLAKNYRNLILDIRGNTGGSLEGGITLAGYLTTQEEPTGVYLTQQWFNEHPEPPTATEMAAMPAFTKADLAAFTEELEEKGIVVLKARPGPQQFAGKLFVLTDRKSASACEPLTWNLKNTGRATVVGESTAGAMLSAESYSVRNGFVAVIPNGDYYTPDGDRLDLVGVKPNIEVKSEAALEHVLQLLESSN